MTLGTDGFGRSDTREALRRYFETDAPSDRAHGAVRARRRGPLVPDALKDAIAPLPDPHRGPRALARLSPVPGLRHAGTAGNLTIPICFADRAGYALTAEHDEWGTHEHLDRTRPDSGGRRPGRRARYAHRRLLRGPQPRPVERREGALVPARPPATAATSSASVPQRTGGADIDYLAHGRPAAEQLGFEAVLTPTGTWCEDAWITTAALIRETTRRSSSWSRSAPGCSRRRSPRRWRRPTSGISGGRLLLNVVTGGEPASCAGSATGSTTTSATTGPTSSSRSCGGAWSATSRSTSRAGTTTSRARRPRCAARAATGDLLRRRVHRRPSRWRPVTSTSTSPGASRRPWLAERLDRMRELAAEPRAATLRFGIRLHVITRDRAERRLGRADRLLDAWTRASIAAAQKQLRHERVGRPAAHGGAARRQPRATS